MVPCYYRVESGTSCPVFVESNNTTGDWDLVRQDYVLVPYITPPEAQEIKLLIFPWVVFRFYEIEITWPKIHPPRSLPTELYANPIVIRGPPDHIRSYTIKYDS